MLLKKKEQWIDLGSTLQDIRNVLAEIIFLPFLQ